MGENKGIRVLLIDDEQTLLEYLAKRLLREGLTVKVTFSGEEALHVAAEEDYDVAVVDLKMPGIDGAETQRRLKGIQPNLQCIVLTGHGGLESSLESGEEDTYQYLLKPIEFESLMQAIREAYQLKMKLQKGQSGSKEEEDTPAPSEGSGIKRILGKIRRLYGVDND
ncbi:MAG: response regulator [Desulfovermiculus sp.]|nr:response regulator [Desulfovermiculus sp.]